MALSIPTIDQIYQEIVKQTISLDMDPLEFTPSRLQEMIATVRAMQSQTERWFTLASADCQKLRREKHKIDALIKMTTNDLMIHDIDVRTGRSVREREMLAQDKLKEEVTQSEDLTAAIQEIENLLIVIKAKRADLKDISRSVKEQIRLCKDEMDSLGRSFRGNSGPAYSSVTEASLDDIESLLQAPPAPKGDGSLLAPNATVADVLGDVFEGIPDTTPPPPPPPIPHSALEEDEDLSSFLDEL